MSPFSLMAVLLRRWKIVVGVPFVLAVLTLLASFLRQSDYVAQSRFAPQQRSSGNQFAGVAAQLGIPIDMGGGGSSESVQFYAALVASRDLLESAARTKYQLQPPGVDSRVSGTLMELLASPGESDAARLQSAVGWLKSNTVPTVDTRSNLVILNTRAPTRDLATKLNLRLLELVNDFNINRRQTAAAAERKFVEGRVGAAQLELRRSESALMSFMDRNRRYEGSAVKPFEYTRLQREVDLQQSVYASLAQRLEQARVDEVRNTPVVTVIEGPQRSARPVRNLVKSLATALLFGGVLGLALAFAVDYYVLERARNPDAYAELERARPRWLNRLMGRPVV